MKEIAREAVREFLLALGVNVATPEAVIELQKDFHHVRNTRLTVGAVRNEIWTKTVSVLTGGAVTGVLAAIGYYVAHHS